jgi:hypothetical protein
LPFFVCRCSYSTILRSAGLALPAPHSGWSTPMPRCSLLSTCCYLLLAHHHPSLPPPLPDLGPVLPPLGSAACRLTVLGLQNFPSGAPKRAPRAELEACSDRTKIKEKRRRLTCAVNNYVVRRHSRYSASTASTKLIVARSFAVWRSRASLCLHLASIFPARHSRRPARKPLS